MNKLKTLKFTQTCIQREIKRDRETQRKGQKVREYCEGILVVEMGKIRWSGMALNLIKTHLNV